VIHILGDIVIILALASVVLVLAHRLRIPSILGFILTGVLIGPSGLELVSATHEVEMMAEIGVVLLLFSIGLEISFKSLWSMRRIVLGGGGIQVALTIAGGFALFSLFDVDSRTAWFTGFFVALSSTAMVLKLLQDRGEIYSPHGRASVGILLFQDLAVVPIMLLIPALAGAGVGTSLGGQALMALGVLVLVGVAARVVPWLLYLVVRTRNREVFALSVVVICLAVAVLTEAAGMSLALGAFLAGVIISESEYSHEALTIVLPFRHIFASIFFISIGMLLDLDLVAREWTVVVPAFLGVVILKTVATMAALVLIRFPFRTALLTGLGLAQVGEFSFVMLQAASGLGVVGGDTYHVLLAVAVLSLAFTPFLIKLAPALAARLPMPAVAGVKKHLSFDERTHRLEDHVIIAGYGVGGRNVARAVRSCGIPYVILEMNVETVRSMRKDGEPIRYGDAMNEAELLACGVKKARVMVIAISDPVGTRRTIAAAKRLNPALHVVTRTRYIRELPDLIALGADQVIPEEFETSVEMFGRVLAAYLVPHSDIESVASEIRSEGYQMLRAPSPHAFTIRGADIQLPDMEISTFKVREGSPLAGKTLAQSRLGSRHHVTVLAVRREGTTVANPRAGDTLAPGDAVVAMGTVSALGEVAGLFASGFEADRGP
jgi:CPA2 family monovalent cation:H+ antiporter-2